MRIINLNYRIVQKILNTEIRRPVGSMRFPIMQPLSGQMNGFVKRSFLRIFKDCIYRVFDGTFSVEYSD